MSAGRDAKTDHRHKRRVTSSWRRISLDRPPAGPDKICRKEGCAERACLRPVVLEADCRKKEAKEFRRSEGKIRNSLCLLAGSELILRTRELHLK